MRTAYRHWPTNSRHKKGPDFSLQNSKRIKNTPCQKPCPELAGDRGNNGSTLPAFWRSSYVRGICRKAPSLLAARSRRARSPRAQLPPSSDPSCTAQQERARPSSVEDRVHTKQALRKHRTAAPAGRPIHPEPASRQARPPPAQGNRGPIFQKPVCPQRPRCCRESPRTGRSSRRPWPSCVPPSSFRACRDSLRCSDGPRGPWPIHRRENECVLPAKNCFPVRGSSSQESERRNCCDSILALPRWHKPRANSPAVQKSAAAATAVRK